MEKDEKKLERLSEITGKSIEELEYLLGFSSQVCNAVTLEEAEAAYRSAPDGSVAQKVALDAMIQFCHTFRGASNVYVLAPKGSVIQEAALHMMIQFCSTTIEAEEAYDLCARESEAEILALDKWIQLCTTFQETLKVYRLVVRGENKILALKKLYEFL